MNQIIFQRDILINAPIAHVWQLVATEDGLRQWWGNTIAIEAKEGGRCEEWRTERNRVAHWQGVVTDYTPPHQMTMTLRAQPEPMDAPNVTTIHIALATEGTQTRVHVTHRAFATIIDTDRPRDLVPQTDRPRSVPLAQLNHPAPGSIVTPMPSLPWGKIDPTHLLVTRGQTEALTVTWQARLTSLVTSAVNAQ